LNAERSTQESVAIGERLRAVRGSASQREAADLLGVHKNTYAAWERGESEIGATALARLCNEGWNPRWLLTGEGSQRQERGIEWDGIAAALEVVETALEGMQRKMTPKAKSHAVRLAYEILDNAINSGTPMPGVMAEVLRIVREAEREPTHVGQSRPYPERSTPGK
jgi:transcriptional regulator with XRE-family HTH domain